MRLPHAAGPHLPPTPLLQSLRASDLPSTEALRTTLVREHLQLGEALLWLLSVGRCDVGDATEVGFLLGSGRAGCQWQSLAAQDKGSAFTTKGRQAAGT